jgi:hypothetical protein
MKEYITELKFGSWRNEIWLAGEENKEQDFFRAEQDLPELAGKCTNGAEFFSLAVENFRKYGFKRARK